MSDWATPLTAAVRDGDRSAAVALTQSAIDAGIPPERILSEGLVPGIQALGALFKDGQAFLPEILVSARAMDQALDVLRPHLAGGEVAARATVVIGTVEGDLHDIGKNLVGMMLGANGFSVVDLGADVSAERFAQAALDEDADIVALSALLTTTTPQFRDVLFALDASGVRGAVKVMIGGAPVSQALADELGADGFADDCIAAVEEAERLLADEEGR
jgi:5-methyltetrahydrofolate--homocysteine methyltransferase